MIGILEEIGMSIEDLEENTVALGEEIDAISDDLSDVEKAVFDEDDDDDDCCCGDEDCPNCGDTLMIDESVLEEGVIQCPGCKQKFALDLSDDCCCGDGDEDGCGCGCEEHDHD